MKIKDYCKKIITKPNLNMKTIEFINNKIWFHDSKSQFGVVGTIIMFYNIFYLKIY